MNLIKIFKRRNKFEEEIKETYKKILDNYSHLPPKDVVELLNKEIGEKLKERKRYDMEKYVKFLKRWTFIYPPLILLLSYNSIDYFIRQNWFMFVLQLSLAIFNTYMFFYYIKKYRQTKVDLVKTYLA